MYNPLRRGTPDVWYSGEAADLWVEYKFVQKPAKTINPEKLLSPLQARWIKQRQIEGRNVAVIIGSPTGGIFLSGPSIFLPFSSALLMSTKQELALHLEGILLYGRSSSLGSRPNGSEHASENRRNSRSVAANAQSTEPKKGTRARKT